MNDSPARKMLDRSIVLTETAISVAVLWQERAELSELKNAELLKALERALAHMRRIGVLDKGVVWERGDR